VAAEALALRRLHVARVAEAQARGAGARKPGGMRGLRVTRAARRSVLDLIVTLGASGLGGQEAAVQARARLDAGVTVRAVGLVAMDGVREEDPVLGHAQKGASRDDAESHRQREA